MKNLLFCSVISFLVSCMLVGCISHRVHAKRVVLIGLDGISVEGYNTANIPNLDRLFSEGVVSLETRNVMPSVTLPNWTSILTGSGPEQHGVVNNLWRFENPDLPPMESDEKGYYPSIYKILKEQVTNIKTAFYYNAEFLIWPFNQEYIDEVSYEENDCYLQNYIKAFDFILENKDNPTFVLLYTVHTDAAGHNYGWMSPEYIKSIEEVDFHIGELIGKLKSENLFKDTHFMFLTDHGGIGKKHGGVSTTEMILPWAISGPGIKKIYNFKSPNNTINTAPTVARLFGCEPPLSWIGSVPESIFEK